jgi:hypothetical protein
MVLAGTILTDLGPISTFVLPGTPETACPVKLLLQQQEIVEYRRRLRAELPTPNSRPGAGPLYYLLQCGAITTKHLQQRTGLIVNEVMADDLQPAPADGGLLGSIQATLQRTQSNQISQIDTETYRRQFENDPLSAERDRPRDNASIETRRARRLSPARTPQVTPEKSPETSVVTQLTVPHERRRRSLGK